MNRARANRIMTSGNQILDSNGNVWNVLMVDSNIKSAHCWYQLIQLRDAKGHRKYDKLLQSPPGRTQRSAKKKLIEKYYYDQLKNVKYDAINNEIKGVIE